jgi:hypothetical protein
MIMILEGGGVGMPSMVYLFLEGPLFTIVGSYLSGIRTWRLNRLNCSSQISVSEVMGSLIAR